MGRVGTRAERADWSGGDSFDFVTGTQPCAISSSVVEVAFYLFFDPEDVISRHVQRSRTLGGEAVEVPQFALCLERHIELEPIVMDSARAGCALLVEAGLF